MALPTSADLLNMQYAFQAQPFLDQAAKSAIVLLNMEYAYQAQPFVRNPSPTGGAAARPFGNITQRMMAAGAI